MKAQKITFRYDTLYIFEDRYEFKKIRKRSLGVIFCGIFNRKFVHAILYTLLMWVSVWLLFTFILAGSINEIQFLPLSGPLVLIPVLAFNDRRKNRIIKRKDVISINVKNNSLKILYADRGRKIVKEVELHCNTYTEADLSDILEYDIAKSSVIDWMGSDKFHFKMGVLGCFICVLFFMDLLKKDPSIGLIITNAVLVICCFMSIVDSYLRLCCEYYNNFK